MKRPNFLFIMTDTLCHQYGRCYSGKPLNTQNIDSLAAEGIRFNSAYTCSPVYHLHAPDYSPVSTLTSPARGLNNVAPGKTFPPWALL